MAAIRITADLSETLQSRREWQDILKVMKEKNLQTKNTTEDVEKGNPFKMLVGM